MTDRRTPLSSIVHIVNVSSTKTIKMLLNTMIIVVLVMTTVNAAMETVLMKYQKKALIREAVIKQSYQNKPCELTL